MMYYHHMNGVTWAKIFPRRLNNHRNFLWNMRIQLLMISRLTCNPTNPHHLYWEL
jgi:hypothetical protein